MQPIDQFCQELKLNPQQATAVKQYVSSLVIELLESLKQENLQNFDETIDNLKGLGQ